MIWGQMAEQFEFVHSARWLWVWLLSVFLYVRFIYRRELELANVKWRPLLMALRIAILMIPLIFLYEPQRTWEERFEKKNTLMVMVDKSLSMSVTSDEYVGVSAQQRLQATYGDAYASLSRWDQQQKLLADLRNQVGENNQLKIVSYGSEMREWVEPVSWDGTLERHTRLAQALSEAVNRTEEISGIIVFGDGNVDDPQELLRVSDRLKNRRRNIPLFSVGLGSPEVVPDLRAVQFHAPEVVVKSDDPVTFKGIVSARGVPTGTEVKAKLTLQGDVLEETVATLTGAEREEVSFEWILDQAGEFPYTFELEPVEGETVVANNSKTVTIKVKDEKLKTLYIENFPRWDYLKVAQFLERNPKIYESSFYLIQAGHRIQQKGSRPIRKIPETFDQLWESTDVVILGEVGIKFFTGSPFLDNLEKFVSRGGGLIYLTGPANNPISYKDSILEKLCPVFLAPDHLERARGAEPKAPVSLKPTDVGLTHPLTRLASQVEVSAAYWQGLPPTQWFYRPHGIKPLTQVLIEHPEKTCSLDNQNVPLVALMPYGKGQVLYLGVDELHRWSFLDDQEYVVNRFLAQAINYMSSRKISGTAGRYLLETNTTELFLGDAFEVSVQFDEASEVVGSSLEVFWSLENEEIQTLSLNRESVESDIFKGQFKPERKGRYTFWLDEVGQRKQVSVTDFSKEFENSELNKALLQKFSGEENYFDFDQIEELVSNILSQQIVETRHKAQSLLVEPLVWAAFFLLVSLLGAEWWIRKRQHLL